MTSEPELQPDSEEAVKAARKKASQVGLLLGALTLVLGSLVCLFYLLYFKPWKFQ